MCFNKYDKQAIEKLISSLGPEFLGGVISMEMGLEVMASWHGIFCYSVNGAVVWDPARYVTNEPCCAHFRAHVNVV